MKKGDKELPVISDEEVPQAQAHQQKISCLRRHHPVSGDTS